MISKKTVVSIVIFSALASAPILTLAAGLVPCGGPDEPPCSLCYLFELAQRITDFLMWTIAPVLAVLAVAWGGFNIFIAGGAPDRVSVGRQAITRAGVGLLITFGAWVAINETLIFFSQQQQGTATIFSNPWTDIKCSTKVLPKQTVAPSASSATTGPTGCDNSGSANDRNGCVRLALNAAGVQVKTNYCASFDSCTPSNSCTTVAQLPDIAVNNLIVLNQIIAGRATLTVTGGTERGTCHATHGPGLARVDIEKNPTINALIQGGTHLGTQASCSSLGPAWQYLNNIYVDESTHWHVCYY